MEKQQLLNGIFESRIKCIEKEGETIIEILNNVIELNFSNNFCIIIREKKDFFKKKKDVYEVFIKDTNDWIEKCLEKSEKHYMSYTYSNVNRYLNNLKKKYSKDIFYFICSKDEILNCVKNLIYDFEYLISILIE